MEKLEYAANNAVDWIKCNYMKLNPDKCHLLICGDKEECLSANIGGELVIESHQEKLLGVQIDSKLKFDNHVKNLCKKAGKKLNVLGRQCNILPFHKRRILMNSFFNSQFSYCPLVWMFSSRELNTEINNLQYRALRLVYRDITSTYEELLSKDGSITTHQKNIHALVIEMYKVQNNLAPGFMCNIFPRRTLDIATGVANNTRNYIDFYNHSNPRSTKWGLETLRHLGPRLWKGIPESVRNAPSLASFKIQIKKWKADNCPCKLCKTYINSLGYIE